LDLWKKLYETAYQYEALSPWKKLEEDQVFAFIDPISGQEFYCCVLGSGGEFLGLAIYRGKEGIEGFLQLKFKEVDPSSIDACHLQNALVVEFTSNKKGVEKEDLSIMKALGLPMKAPYLCFRNHLPGFKGWFFDEEDVLSFTFGLECAIYHITHNLEAFSHVRIESMHCPLYSLHDPADAPIWQVKEHSLKRLPKKQIEPITVDRKAIEGLKGIKLCHDTAWEVSLTNTTSPLWDHARPYFAKVAMIVHQESFFILHGEVLPLNETIGDFFCKQILFAIQKHKRLPGELLFNNPYLYESLKPFMKSLGIQGTLLKVLPATIPAQEGLLEKMRF
jgi:hypothetical protein